MSYTSWGSKSEKSLSVMWRKTTNRETNIGKNKKSTKFREITGVAQKALIIKQKQFTNPDTPFSTATVSRECSENGSKT